VMILGLCIIFSRCIKIIASGDVSMVRKCCLVVEIPDSLKGYAQNQYHIVRNICRTTYIFDGVIVVNETLWTVEYNVIEIVIIVIKHYTLSAN
jgi:hypothetical protein